MGEKIMTEDEVWADVAKGLDEYHNECNRVNVRILKAIKSQLGPKFHKSLIVVLEECEAKDKLCFSKKPKGDYQKENYTPIKGYYVDQRSVGDSGDSFEGTISILLKTGMYLEVYFEC